jgi:hypothetical protein
VIHGPASAPSWIASVALAVGLAVCARGASAAEGGDQHANLTQTSPPPEVTPSRTAVVLGLAGPLDPEGAAALRDLIESDLSGHEPNREITLRRASGAAWVWIASARRDPRALLIGLLELRASGVWRVYLVDAARGRAIVRELPGEAAGNSTALESVASVVSSAIRALDEGLEIGSRPVAEVVGGPPIVPMAARRQAPSARQAHLDASLSTALSTFSAPSTFTLGLCTSLRLVLPSAFLLGLSVTPSWPTHFQSEFGDFEVQRTQAQLSVGAELRRGSWRLSAEGGPALELLRRRSSRAQPGAHTLESASLSRAGPQLIVGARYQLSKRLALAMALAGAYFPQRIRYTLIPESHRTLASPWAASGMALLGLEFSLVQ